MAVVAVAEIPVIFNRRKLLIHFRLSRTTFTFLNVLFILLSADLLSVKASLILKMTRIEVLRTLNRETGTVTFQNVVKLSGL